MVSRGRSLITKWSGGSTWARRSVNAAPLYLDPVIRPGDDLGHGADAKVRIAARPAAGDDSPAAAGYSPAPTVQHGAVTVRGGGSRAQPAAGARRGCAGRG